MHDRSRILQSIDLGELATELCGPPVHGKWPCPNTEHAQTGRTPPVSVFRTRDGYQRWRCHGCGAGGTAIDLTISARHVDVREAMDWLAGRARISPTRPAETPVPRERPAADLSEFIAECAARLWRPEGATVRQWAMGERGLDEAVLRRNRVGADCVERPRPESVPAVGPALVLPTHQHQPVSSLQLRPVAPKPGRAKYVSPSGHRPGPRIATYIPAGLPLVRTLYVTEGPVDALTAAQLGIPAVAALGVHAVDEALAQHLAMVPPDTALVLAFDTDEPGRAAQKKLRNLLWPLRRDNVELRYPAGAKDLNHWHTLRPNLIARLAPYVAPAASERELA